MYVYVCVRVTYMCESRQVLVVPVNYASFLHMSDDDAMMAALGATSSCYLYTEGFLTFNYMHLPDVVYVSGLQKKRVIKNKWKKKTQQTAGQM